MTGLLATATRGPLACLMTALLVTATVLAACTADDSSEPTDPPSSSTTPEPSPTEAEASTTAPAPRVGECHRMTYDAVVAPTAARRSVPCDRPHTAETFAVGRLETLVDGRLLAVDSDRVQEQVASACPKELAGFVGGSEEQRRLSMLRAVWFTPTLEQADTGADWFRCDAVVLAEDSRLLEVEGSLEGALDTEQGRQRFGLCGTAEPGTPRFRRVACREPHTWRTLRTVELPGEEYPGEEQAARIGETPCREAARNAAPNPLDYQWGYEWPTEDQWEAGQTWGVCWVPAS